LAAKQSELTAPLPGCPCAAAVEKHWTNHWSTTSTSRAVL